MGNGVFLCCLLFSTRFPLALAVGTTRESEHHCADMVLQLAWMTRVRKSFEGHPSWLGSRRVGM